MTPMHPPRRHLARIAFALLLLAAAPSGLRADFVLGQDSGSVSLEVRNAAGITEGGPTLRFGMSYPNSPTASGSLFDPTLYGAAGEGGSISYHYAIFNNAQRNQGTEDVSATLTMVGAGSAGSSMQHTFVYSMDFPTYLSNPEVSAGVDFTVSGHVADGGRADIAINWLVRGTGQVIYAYTRSITQAGDFSVGDLETIDLGRAKDVLSNGGVTNEGFTVSLSLSNPLGGTSYATIDPGFGNSIPPRPVPEPSSLLLIAVAAGPSLLRYRRRGRTPSTRPGLDTFEVAALPGGPATGPTTGDGAI